MRGAETPRTASPDDRTRFEPGRQGEDRPQRNDDQHVELTALWLPAVKIEADTDRGSVLQFDANLDTGDGWGASFRMLGDGIAAFGLLYMTSEHRVRSVPLTNVDTYSAYAELVLHTRIDWGWGALRPILAGGVGGAVFDFHGGAYDDTGGAAMEGRGLLSLELGKHFVISAGGGAFFWGYPSETLGDGSFAIVEAGIRF
jgi:hypothetical protein